MMQAEQGMVEGTGGKRRPSTAHVRPCQPADIHRLAEHTQGFVLRHGSWSTRVDLGCDPAPVVQDE